MADRPQFPEGSLTEDTADNWGQGLVTSEMQRQNPVWRFLQDTYPGQHTKTGLVEYTIDDESAISLVPTSPKTLKIDSLRALEKNTGAGTRALNLLSQQADKHGVSLEGLIHKFEEEGLSKADLMQFYQKAGWELRYPDKVARSLSEGKALEDIRVEVIRVPRPPDQSNLPAVIDTASAASQLVRTRADEPRPKGKGAAFRGIGSLMRGKIFPLIQALQRGYELLPEDKKVVGDVLDYLQKTKAHELFGMEKSGLEYLKDWLGMEQPPEGGIITLPEKMYLDFYHGTPNKWSSEEGYPVGRPRLDFKGTGEGAQVYAPGFYGGEARAVGYEYAERLAEEHGEVPNVYKGKIREDIVNNKFIDFNLPVNEQSQDVQEVFKKLGYETKTPDRFAGADILLHMERRMGADAAIDALREEGIVGLRYLDKFSRNNKNLYKGKSLVKQDGKALVLNEGWQQQGREVLQYLVDNNMDMDEFVRQQREFYSQKGKISRALRGARQQEKLMDILEGTTVKKSPLTRNVVVWDQPLLDQIGRTIKKEMAAGGFVTKPLYDDARIGGMI